MIITLKIEAKDLKVTSLQVLPEREDNSIVYSNGDSELTVIINVSLHYDPLDYLGLKLVDLFYIKSSILLRFKVAVDLFHYLELKLKDQLS